ncbi:uncharacterized protein LOC111087818 [Limulus polyphemus]|uniref:Uncharacterized protein LOC111087818 n=1 Tax=Limulus polyphemus TaxID=6850 RepID=A0ABM1T6Q5_LIMPO|nr:uncharacterized protein LOC111087818 [Limulus polyphemus]
MTMRLFNSFLGIGCLLVGICCSMPVKVYPRTYLDMVEAFNPGLTSFDGDNRIEEDMLTIQNRMKQERKRTATMGVDLPDYILHYKSGWPDLSSFRDRMQKSGRR